MYLCKKALTRAQAAIVAIIVAVAVIASVAYYLSLPTSPTVQEVKIGWVAPLTGPAAEVGKLQRMGAEFALDEINAAGGIKNLGGAKLTIIWADHGGDPKTGAIEAERLITTENIVALMGCYYSSVTKTVSDTAERYKIPHINPSSTSPKLTERGLKWYFRVCHHDGIAIRDGYFAFFNWMNQQNPGTIEKIAILHEDSEWGVSNAEVIKKCASEFGYEIVECISFHSGTASLDTEMLRIKESNPDFFFFLGYTTDCILCVKTMKKLDFAPKLFGDHSGFMQPAYWESTKELSYYTIEYDTFSIDLLEILPQLKEKNAAFKEKYGQDISDCVARAYIGVYVAYSAIEEAAKVASPTNLEEFRKAVRDALVKMDIGKDVDWMILPWDGIKFDENGQNIRARVIINQMMPDDGRYHIVYPRDIATRDPLLMPPWSER